MTWVTVEEFASWTGEAVSTIRRKCQTGELPSRKFGVRWKIDKDYFEELARKEMLHRMESKPMKLKPKKITISDEEWLKQQRQKLLARIRSV